MRWNLQGEKKCIMPVDWIWAVAAREQMMKDYTAPKDGNRISSKTTIFFNHVTFLIPNKEVTSTQCNLGWFCDYHDNMNAKEEMLFSPWWARELFFPDSWKPYTVQEMWLSWDHHAIINTNYMERFYRMVHHAETATQAKTHWGSSSVIEEPILDNPAEVYDPPRPISISWSKN